MQSLRGGWIRRTAVGATLTTLALLAGLLASSAALAAPDPLAPSSSVVLQLKNFSGIKVKPKTLNLAITRGDLDPTTGAGTIETTGKFTARRSGRKTKVKITNLVFGANGGAGRIDAKVGKRQTKGFGKLSGGTLTRDGFGAKLNGVTAKLGSKGAKALSRALSPGSGKKASAAAGGIKAGKRLGSVAVNAVPRTVEVLPGGVLEFEADPLFAIKLANHCVNGTILDPPGVEPISSGDRARAAVLFLPGHRGQHRPGLQRRKGDQRRRPAPRKERPRPAHWLLAGLHRGPAGRNLGHQLRVRGAVRSQVLRLGHPAAHGLDRGGVAGRLRPGVAEPGGLTPPPATTSVDPNTKQIVITNAQVTMDQLAAVVFNNVFPNASGNPAQDFMPGDSLGFMSLTVTTH